MIEKLLVHPDISSSQGELPIEDIRTTFFKCTRWQLEDTLDPITCPYHYFCDSIYPGNYPPVVDVIVLVFVAASVLATAVFMVLEISGRRGQIRGGKVKRLLVPSGPVSLPIILLILAKGQRINTMFPLSYIGPAILQLVCISSLAFESEADKNFQYAFFEASTISGILHASLHLDSIVLPYLTGLDALVSSTFSGECLSCICRKDVLVVGGRLIAYRGLSATTITVVGTVCLRIICRIYMVDKRILMIKSLLECFGWSMLAIDSAYLIRKSPQEILPLQVCAYSGVIVLICFQLLRKTCNRLTQCQFVHRC